MTEMEIFSQCLKLGMTKAGAAGCTANIIAESAGRPNNVEDRSCINDDVYTRGVDNGTYHDFVTDHYGYGLCQWTKPERKRALLDYARGKGVSISDAAMQFQFLAREMRQSYTYVWNVLTHTSDPYEAGYIMCKFFEIPANTEATAQARGKMAREVYDRCAGKTPVESPTENKYWPPRTIDRGMSGADVAVLQAVLKARGYDSGAIDGALGDRTVAALQAFQTAAGLYVDGICGPLTWAALLKY